MTVHITTADRLDTISVRGQRIRVRVENEGAGSPFLLINGIGATGELFHPFRQYFGDRETITFDAPGVGASSTPTFPLTMSQLAAIVADTVRELGHDQVDVLGLSWGGALAMHLTWRYPALVRRLVLTATTPGWGALPGRPAAMAILASPARYRSPAYLRRVAPTLYGGGIVDRPDLLDEHAELRSRFAPTQRGYLYQMMAIQAWSALPFLWQIKNPALVLAGDDDPIIHNANGRLLASQLSNGHLHIVEGGGHLFLFVRAEESAEIVREFLDSPLDD